MKNKNIRSCPLRATSRYLLAGFDSKAIEKRLGVARAAALDCTLFKSVGVAFQDVAAGAAVLRAYRRRSRRAGAE